MELKNARQQTLSTIVDINKEEKSFLTGEKNLKLTKEKLIEKVEKINKNYIETMELEASIFVRQGLFEGYFEDGDIYFNIPDWDSFISAIDAFYRVCYTDEFEE